MKIVYFLSTFIFFSMISTEKTEKTAESKKLVELIGYVFEKPISSINKTDNEAGIFISATLANAGYIFCAKTNKGISCSHITPIKIDGYIRYSSEDLDDKFFYGLLNIFNKVISS